MGWQRIKNEYIAGEATLKELAAKYDVSFSTIQKKSAEEGWRKLRKKKRIKVEEKIIDSVSTKEAEKVVNVISVADKLLEKIVEIAEGVLDPDSIKKLTSAIKDIKDIKGDKSELDRQEQMARIAKLQKEAQEETHDKEITIVFGSDAEDYSV